MSFEPIEKMWNRVDTARDHSDEAMFETLMLFGEMLTKLVAAGLVATVTEGVDRNRYRQIHRLVRANGIGEWSQVIDEVITGPTSNHLVPQVREEQRELSQRHKAGTWQYDSVASLYECLEEIRIPQDELSVKVAGRRWFSKFTDLRNKHAHGGIPSSAYRLLCQHLEESIRLVTDNFRLLRRPWVYLHLNLSGKYRVTKLTEDVTVFDPLKSGQSTYVLEGDGVYAFIGQPIYVDLVKSDMEARDFFFPNGSFAGKRYEELSYITRDRRYVDNAPYMAAATERPPSVTQGDELLEIHEDVFSNMPPAFKPYIRRPQLEAELIDKLTDERNPVITLLGRGGIGKTSLSLAVLDQLSKQGRFEALLWFSARDIDLLPEGPKPVRPEILTESDVARVFLRLMKSIQDVPNEEDPLLHLAEGLSDKTRDRPFLFVFDNFETVHNPVELFRWVNEYIRLPNKVLITTRFRQFKADWPVEVPGMTYAETQELIDVESRELGINRFLDDTYRQELFDESEGHPYVVKVLLGEVKKADKPIPIKRIVASQDEILDALFERTYKGLSPAAKYLFLALCSWRSTVPLLALEAVMLHSSEERIDVARAVEELSQSSFVEILESKSGDQFITVPLVAAPFGKGKLTVSLQRNKISAEMGLLRAFGVTKPADIVEGVGTQIDRFFRYLEGAPESVDKYLPMSEFIARRHPSAWRHIIYLYEKRNTRLDLNRAKDAVQRYIQSSASHDDQMWAWRKLADLCGRTSDRSGEINALSEMCQLPGIPFVQVGYAAGRFLTLFKLYDPISWEEKQVIVRRLIEVMEGRITEAGTEDISRLVWLCIHVKDMDKARGFTQLGLGIDPRNRYLRDLARKVQVR